MENLLWQRLSNLILFVMDNLYEPLKTFKKIFSVEDMLGYFESGLLLRWLKVRDYKDEYKEVSEISTKDDLEIAKKLIKIFNVETDEKRNC